MEGELALAPVPERTLPCWGRELESGNAQLKPPGSRDLVSSSNGVKSPL